MSQATGATTQAGDRKQRADARDRSKREASPGPAAGRASKKKATIDLNQDPTEETLAAEPTVLKDPIVNFLQVGLSPGIDSYGVHNLFGSSAATFGGLKTGPGSVLQQEAQTLTMQSTFVCSGKQLAGCRPLTVSCIAR